MENVAIRAMVNIKEKRKTKLGEGKFQQKWNRHSSLSVTR